MASCDGSLILVAKLGGPTMFARIGVLRALNHGKPKPAKARAKLFCVIWATLVWFLSLALKLLELQLYLRSSTRRPCPAFLDATTRGSHILASLTQDGHLSDRRRFSFLKQSVISHVALKASGNARLLIT
jgi:hypothetical protein